MTERRHGGPIRRIVVGVDESAHSRAALEAAAELAEAFEAELEGVFVEDVNVLRAVEHTFGYEISVFSGSPRSVQVGELERQLRERARRLQELFDRIARRSALRRQFRTVRGRVDAELHQAVGDEDLLALGRRGASGSERSSLGSTARSLAVEGPRSMLLLPRGRLPGSGVCAVVDDGERAREALEVAAALARRQGTDLHVLVVGRDDDEARQRAEAAEAQLSETDVRAWFRRVVDPEPARIARLAQGARAGLLVVRAGVGTLQGQALGDMLQELDCAVLLLR